MKIRLRPPFALIAFTAATGLLTGCADNPGQSKLRLSDDFGHAVNQDLAAQIADPDAGLKAGPPPPSSGDRAALAQRRYQHDVVIQPSTEGASGRASGSGNNGGAAMGAGGGSGGP